MGYLFSARKDVSSNLRNKADRKNWPLRKDMKPTPINDKGFMVSTDEFKAIEKEFGNCELVLVP